ncbi:MAG: energy-coupled thiamine transporter ThiT [Firmicutes bacterium]|nr:energy-coupled thiamine transporter ThiT [Bacillota bacterium]MBR5926160.1 energy-coupled thiamine transporter ThiT [Bacillota bacterium]MBR6025407.1 energy-coupled thiamine transporter ThiT [Bacillota bacterium]
MSEVKNSYSTTRVLVECALLIAIGTVLSKITLYSMPMGGSVTLLSLLPFIIISFRHGTKWGLISGIANVILQIVVGGLYMPPAGTALALAGSIFLDYVLGFMVFGLAAFFAKPFKNKAFGVAFGSAFTCFLRFMASFVSGFLIWASITEEGISAVTYSLGYNASYMVPETVLTTAAAYLIYKKAPQIFASVK